jgi:hypothetical protein
VNNTIHQNNEGVLSSWVVAMKHAVGRFRFARSNQRQFPRFDCMIPVDIHLDTPGQISVISAVAKNISSGGMLIKCAAAFDSLTSCHLSFHMPGWFPSTNRTCEVMTYAHVRHADASGQLLGLSFDTPL